MRTSELLWEELDVEGKIWAYIIKDYIYKLYPKEIVGGMSYQFVWDNMMEEKDRNICFEKYEKVVKAMKGD